jgi:hypothetical protein
MKGFVEISGIRFEVEIEPYTPRVVKVELAGFDFTRLIFDNGLEEQIIEEMSDSIGEFNLNQQKEYEQEVRERTGGSF